MVNSVWSRLRPDVIAFEVLLFRVPIEQASHETRLNMHAIIVATDLVLSPEPTEAHIREVGQVLGLQRQVAMKFALFNCLVIEL